MSKNRTYRWYVEPVGADANQYIYRLIEGTGVDELQISGAEAQDGRTHYVYECTHQQLNTIRNSLGGLDMVVHFWVKEGNGKYRKWQPEAIQNASRRNRALRRKEKQPVLPFYRKH